MKGLQRTFSTVACRFRILSDCFSIWPLTIHGTTKKPISAYSATAATTADRQLTSRQDRNHPVTAVMGLSVSPSMPT